MVAQSINTSYAVIVLGDHGTLEVDDLAVKAAEQGAVIAESYSFEPGEPASSDDLAEVDAVVSALSRAIATRVDVWVPFPIADFGREEHLRRVSLVLQRHGLNMLMGGELEPCTTDGGFNPVDFALRAEVRAVETAAQMQAALTELAPTADVVVMAAAVADFRPVVAAEGKIKKHDGVPQIVLEPTPDILAGLGATKRPGQVLVGFAAETSDLVANATDKMRRKRLDLMVANDVGAPGVGFQHDTNAVTLLRPDADPVTVSLRDKRAIAAAVLDSVSAIRAAGSAGCSSPRRLTP